MKTTALVLAFDLAWAAVFVLVGAFLAVFIGDVAAGALRAHRAQSPLDADPSTVNEVRVACFGRPGRLGSSTNVADFLLTVTRSAVTVESQTASFLRALG